MVPIGVRLLYVHFIQTMHVVLRGITIWTLYTSIACRSTGNVVRWELVFDPVVVPAPDEPSLQQDHPPPPVPDEQPALSSPDESFERFVSLSHYLTKRLQANSDFAPDDAVAAAVRESSNVAVAAAAASTAARGPAAACECTPKSKPVELSDEHYPRVLPAVACHGGQWCKRTVYPVRVLIKKTAAAVNEEAPPSDASSYIRDGLPNELIRQNWRFVQIDVTVACTCIKSC